MATTTRLSLEEFHRMYDGVKPYYEYWFGEAIQKPSRGILEGLLTAVVGIFLHERCWKVATSVTLKMSPNAELIPDVVATRRKVEQPYPTKPVEICVEILSGDYGLDKGLEKGKRQADRRRGHGNSSVRTLRRSR
jgi:Uma2 family endonuclease